jgi:hypothetical protein
MGMGWDMGPPTWPYRSVQIISYAINLPVYRVLWLILELHHLYMYPSRYALWFSTIVVLGRWVGPIIDFGLWGSRRYSHRKLIVAILLMGALALLSLATPVGWARQYCRGHPPIDAFLFLGAAGEMLWCSFFAEAFVRSAARLLRRRPSPEQAVLGSIYCDPPQDSL